MLNKLFYILMFPGWIWATWSYYKGKDQKFCTYCAYFITIVTIIEEISK